MKTAATLTKIFAIFCWSTLFSWKCFQGYIKKCLRYNLDQYYAKWTKMKRYELPKRLESTLFLNSFPFLKLFLENRVRAATFCKYILNCTFLNIFAQCVSLAWWRSNSVNFPNTFAGPDLREKLDNWGDQDPLKWWWRENLFALTYKKIIRW